MRQSMQVLNVFMNDLLVGILIKYKHGGISFSYDESWLQHPGARPISLSLPLTAELYQGDLVYNFFDNLLPDNPQIRTRIQAKFQIPTAQPFDLLAAIGRDCIGAIQICPDTKPLIKQVKAEPLNEKAIAMILRNFRLAPLGMVSADEDFRISISGAQEKAAFLWYKNRWHRPLATTPTTHIFKLPIGVIEHQNIDLTNSCENEWLCTQIAREFGLPVANSEIQYFEEVKTLIVERFDRKWSQDNTWLMRLPIEDFCQALGFSPNLKYEADGGPGISAIMRVLIGSKNSFVDREIFFRTQILFFLLAAIDGHAKNFSLFLEPYGAYRLAPLYDIMSAHPLLMSKQLQKEKIKMAMAFFGKNKHYLWHTIKYRHFSSTAAKTDFPIKEAEKILQEMLGQIEAVITNILSYIPANFPENITHAIFNGMRQARDCLVT